MDKKIIKIVLDTNFYISLLLKSQICVIIFKSIVDQKTPVFICKEIISEILRVVTYPRIQKYITLDEIYKLKDLFLAANNVYFISPDRSNIILNDKNDQKILETALTAKADFLITRNLKHFQQAKKIKSLKIITPEQFLHLLRM